MAVWWHNPTEFAKFRQKEECSMINELLLEKEKCKKSQFGKCDQAFSNLIMKSLFVYLILLVSVLGWSHRSHDDSRRVLLSSVQTLTFYDNKYTTGKRSRLEIGGGDNG